MDILPHRIESRLEGEIVGHRILSGKAELRSCIESPRAEGIETGKAGTSFQGELVVNPPAVGNER